MASQMKIKLEQKRKRGRPTGRNRVPLTAEERRARNAQYERERRDQQAEAMVELADAMGCDSNMNNADILATVVSYLSRVSSKKTNSNNDLRRQNETMLREISLFKQQWGLSMEDDSDTSDSGVIVESAESEAYEYDSGDSSSRSESKPYSTCLGYNQSLAGYGQGPASFSQDATRFGQDSPNHETILGISQGPDSGTQTTSYDQAFTACNQSAVKRFKTSGGYVVGVPVGYGQDSYSYTQHPAGYKQEQASDEEVSGLSVQQTADYDEAAVSYGQPIASYVQPPSYKQESASYYQESTSDEEGTTAGCKQVSARTRPYVKSNEIIKLERASSAASAVSQTSPQYHHGLEGSMPPGFKVEPSVGAAEIPQGPCPMAPIAWHQAQRQPLTQTSQGLQAWSSHGVISPQVLQVPPPQTSPPADPWIDTLIRTYLG